MSTLVTRMPVSQEKKKEELGPVPRTRHPHTHMSHGAAQVSNTHEYPCHTHMTETLSHTHLDLFPERGIHTPSRRRARRVMWETPFLHPSRGKHCDGDAASRCTLHRGFATAPLLVVDARTCPDIYARIHVPLSRSHRTDTTCSLSHFAQGHGPVLRVWPLTASGPAVTDDVITCLSPASSLHLRNVSKSNH